MEIVPNRYAFAILDVAIESGKVDQFEEELNMLNEDVFIDYFYEVINYPKYSKIQKIDLVKKLLKGKIDDKLVVFLIIILQSDRINIFDQIVKAYKELADVHRNVHVFEVTSAFELGKEQLEKLTNKLKVMYNSENIKFETIVDSKVIGGIVIKKGDTVIDGTLRKKMEDMRSTVLKNA